MRKYGERFPRGKRDDYARRALELFKREERRSVGIAVVCETFDCCEGTAQNLVSRGRYLRHQADIEKARKALEGANVAEPNGETATSRGNM